MENNFGKSDTLMKVLCEISDVFVRPDFDNGLYLELVPKLQPFKKVPNGTHFKRFEVLLKV